MSDPVTPVAVSALGGASHAGFVTVAEAGLCGMVTLRGDLASKKLAQALKGIGLGLPAPRRITMGGARATAWMSPDELLILVPYAEAPATVAALATALAGEHALAVDVSDARAVFTITGAGADQVIAKLSPADLGALAEGEIRRTRIAQVAGAFWRSAPDQITLVTFRSVAAYVMGVLAVSSRKGSTLD